MSEPNYRALAHALTALSHPSRLRLLHTLTVPHHMAEIRLPPEKGDAVEAPDARSISRQAVRQHLRTLVDVGVVAMAPGDPHNPGRQATYSLDAQRLFALIEEIRLLGRLRATEGSDTTRTAALPPAGAPRGARVAEPHLLVVHGATEGGRFNLPPGPGRWTVGRTRVSDVPIEWDPYVSSDHLLLEATAGGTFEIHNLSTNLNGSTLNFRPIAKGESAPLAHGDVLGVGRTLLVFRER